MKKLEKIMDIEFDAEWTTRDLYNKMYEYFDHFPEGDCALISKDDEKKAKIQYSGFLMVIQGWYNKAMCDDNRFKTLSCYAKEEYNSLLNDSGPCLYIYSKYPDFKTYEVIKVKMKDKGQSFTNIQIFGIRRSWQMSALHRFYYTIFG